jgi:RsiW-degrading membrane proteinase PrsW (M82 family)
MTLLTVLPLFLGEEINAASLLQTAGLAALGITLGIPLAIAGWFGWKERPALPFDPARIWWGWVALIPAFLFLVALGAAVSYLLPPTVAPWILPPIHAVTMCIPPLLVLGLVGWGLGGNGGSRREMVAGMAGGGCLGMMISLIGEILIVVAVIVIVAIVVVAMPGSMERMRTLSEQLQSSAWQADVANIADVVLSPVVIASVLGLFCIPVPIIEETSKALAGGVASGWVRPRPARAFAWGVAAGAGFALAENLFNGAVGGVEGWVLGAVTRTGTTAMHCFASGLVGWGWGQLWSARRPLRLLGALASAMTIHGIWNAAAVGLSFSSIAVTAVGGNVIQAGIVGLVFLLCAAALLIQTVAFVAGLPLIARRLAAQEEPSQSDDDSTDRVSAPAMVDSLTP